ncbi:MAG: ABC transporter substrate-binding protein [Desulfobacteraceae bacterium]|nr:ABC transporter substrate-binding protein [Desulfobacteraceae bacterium]
MAEKLTYEGLEKRVQELEQSKSELVPRVKLIWVHGMYFKNQVQYFFSILLLILGIMLMPAKNIEAKDSERDAVEKTAVNSNYEEKLNPVRLELCWSHQFQFAGYYAAVERGFYRDAGFQVTISEGRTEKIPVEELVSGRADYAVGTSSMLAHRLHGKPIVVLASIFQHSAQILLAKKESGISTPQDLIGRRVMLFGGNEDAEPKALLLKEGISLEQINIIPSSFNLNALIEGETDVFVAYSTNEPFYLESQKIPVSIIDPKTYGINFYGDCLFTSERELKERPNQVKAFREASLRGWQYAMKHPEEIIDLILTTYGTKNTREQLLFEAIAIRKLMLPDLIKIGHMNPGRWYHMADTYVELGMADPGFSLEGFIYDPNPMPDYTWIRWVIGVAIAIILLISLSALILKFTNTKLKVEIDNRKQAEEMLLKSKERYRILVENNPYGIQEIDCDGKILFANKKYHQMLGFEGQSLIGQSVIDIQSPGPLRDALPGYFEMLIKDNTPPTPYFCTQLTKQGEERNIEVAWNYQKDTEENVTGFISVLTDITTRKETEEALRIKDYIIDSASSIIATFDFDGMLTFINPLFFEKTGYNPEEVIGKHFSQFWSVGEYYEEIMNMLSKKRKWEGELEINKKDGLKIDVQVSAATIFDENQNPIGLMSSSIDITERKTLEEQLRQAHKMESIGILAGGVAHEFNNLLYMIVGNTELALDGIPEWNPVYSNLEEIKSACLRAAGVVKQLLHFCRKTNQDFKPMGAVTIIKDTIDFLRPTIPSTINLKTTMPDTDIPILGDTTQINQIFMNLFANASQAMQETGGTIEIDIGTVNLDEEDCKNYTNLSEGNHIKITVKDSGPGIAPDIIDKVFDPYFSTKGLAETSGMGLAVVHGIVKNHDGVISVDSNPGQGATFNILLPVIDELPEPEIKVKEEIPHGTESILFVDDEASIVNMTKKTLEGLGYQIETQLNPVEALELFKAKPESFDLVITDMTMPQMTGVNLAEKLKAIKPDIPVIICTGHSAIIDEEKAKLLGIDGLVMKPVSKLNIAKAIRDVLDK